MYRLLFAKRVFKDLDRLPQDDFERIENSIQMLNQNPLPAGSKKLVGERNMYRIRQGVYRVIYTVDHKLKEVHILGVRHRKDSYR
ncbi:MAG TPA: type II toxin-antitoxin system RelE/ParE family toxin [Nitrospirota bacterium]|nr:type II toxin-antitoxin system RelE/ParE family toxin [Nitrospirota bacterium]